MKINNLLYLIVVPILTAVSVEVDNVAEEIQHAVCRIASEEINATANATVTRQLKGVCTSTEFNTRIDNLEQLLLRELNYIKQAVLKIIQIAGDDIEENKIPEEPIERKSAFETKQFDVPKSTEANIQAITESTLRTPTANNFRQHEIDAKNMTIKDNGPLKEFTYFWTIDNILELIANDISIVSGNIYIDSNVL